VENPRWKWPDVVEIHRARPETDSRNQRFDRRATEAACEFLEEHFIDMTYDRPESHRPLLLKVSLLQPHYPYITTREKLNYYFNRVRPFIDEPVSDHPFLSLRSVKLNEEVTAREIRRATAAYYGMIETVDEHFGQVLDRLELVGQNIDEWIIVYTSDHGEMLGEHGIWEKQKFYEASARVPLIIRWPSRFKPRVVTENVNLCDLFATLCDLAGLPIPPGLDSRSLVPLMNGDSAEWRAGRNETVSQFHAKNLMIKWDDLKYQWYGDDCPEALFDLKSDPREMRNAINDVQYADLLPEFRKRRDELGFAPKV
jgi:choline-sulfatase